MAKKFSSMEEMSASCQKQYLSVADKCGYDVPKKYTEITYIDDTAKKAVSGLFANQDMMIDCRQDMKMYFFMLVSTAFENGVSLAAMVDDEPDLLKQPVDIVSKLSAPNPLYARERFTEYYDVSGMEFSDLCSRLYDAHDAIMRKCDPHSSEEAEACIKESLYWLFRLGVTMVLM